MSFLYPEVLYFILPIVLVLFGFLLTQKDAESHFFSDEVMSKLRVNSNGLSIQVRNTLFFLSTLFIVISLSGPVIDNGTIEIKSKSADIMVALDISDSMLGEDVYPNRLKASKQKMIDLLEITSSQRIGVIAFAKNSYLVSPLSFDHSAVRFLVKQLSTDSITEKGTDFLSILNVVDSSIESESKKYLLLFSDGGDKDDFSKEIAFAKENNIVVFIIGMGTKKGSPIKLKDGSFIKQNGAIIISKLNENIAQLATKTGGVYIQGVNATDDIKVMMKEIERISEKKELKSEEIQNFIPLFYYPLGLAIFILLIATSSSPTKKFSKLFSFLFLLAIFIPSQDAHAGFLDFLELDDAQKAYNNGEFEKSQQLYGEYAKTTKNAQSYYNEGNALYKQGKFKEAIGSYEKAVFDDDRSRAKKYANIGNSYVKERSEDSLQKAQDSYEKSLKFNEDKDTRENLEAVKKAIKEQKKQENKKDDDEKNKDNDKKDDKKSEEEKDSKDKSSDDKKDSDNKSEKKSEDKESKEDKEKKDSEQQKNEDSNATKEDTNSSEQQSPPKELQNMMSDAEQAKWLKQLNSEQNTYMYRLNDQKLNKEDTDEKPW